jgi:hypothetical protein
VSGSNWDNVRNGLLSPTILSRTNLPVQEGVVTPDVGRQVGCIVKGHRELPAFLRGGFQMFFSRQFATGIATLISLGIVTVDYLFHHSDATLFFLYFWMVLYFLFAMAVMLCANLAFQVATARWSSLSKAGRSSHVIVGWVVGSLLTWLAFWHQHIFLWMVFALTPVATFWIQFNEWRCTPRTR